MFREIPQSVISTWPPANHIDPITRGPELKAIAGIFVILATVAFLGRLYTRIYIRNYFGIDDWLICFAYLAAFGVTVIAAIGYVRAGWDRHLWDVTTEKLRDGLQLLYFSRICWGLATSAVRLSICCLFYRLLAPIGAPRPYLWTLHVFTSFNVALALANICIGIVPCLPIRAYWEVQHIDGQRCIDDSLAMRTFTVINTACEVVLACMPVYAVFRLHVDRRQRLTVISLLSLSYLVALAGCIRAYYLWRTMNTIDYDMTWYAVPHFIAAEVEICAAIICACVAPLRPAVSAIRGRFTRFPSRLSHPGQSNDTHTPPQHSKAASSYEEATYAGCAPPLSKYVDLEGIACDEFGYKVTISGPPQSRFRPLKRRASKPKLNLRESAEPILRRPTPSHQYRPPKEWRTTAGSSETLESVLEVASLADREGGPPEGPALGRSRTQGSSAHKSGTRRATTARVSAQRASTLKSSHSVRSVQHTRYSAATIPEYAAPTSEIDTDAAGERAPRSVPSLERLRYMTGPEAVELRERSAPADARGLSSTSLAENFATANARPSGTGTRPRSSGSPGNEREAEGAPGHRRQMSDWKGRSWFTE